MKAHWAPRDFAKDLVSELRLKNVQIIQQLDRLFIVENHKYNIIWAENTWQNAQKANFNSIGDAQKILKKLGGFSCLYPTNHFRRANLIQDGLMQLKGKPLDFFSELKKKKILNWALLDKNELIYSLEETLPVARGEFKFNENKKSPSRAYLKLWETFTRIQLLPQPGDKCVDLGAAPGGWSSVLLNLGCNVVAVDKAKLDPELHQNKKLLHIKKDAFTIEPEQIGSVDWLFSDIICYPERLYELVQAWLESGLAQNIVVTIKFQGKTDFKILGKFESIPGSQCFHLFNNKHEVTWVRLMSKK